MFVSNIKDRDCYYKCNGIIGNYLISHGIPLLGREGKHMYFAKTDKLKAVLDKLPVHLRLLMKVGIN